MFVFQNTKMMGGNENAQTQVERPWTVQSHINNGWMALKAGDFNTAANEFSNAISNIPNDPKNPDAARIMKEDIARMAVDGFKSYGDAATKTGNAAGPADYNKAGNNYEKAADAYHYALGWSQVNFPQNKTEQAKSIDDMKMSYLNAGFSYEKAGNFKASMDVYSVASMTSEITGFAPLLVKSATKYVENVAQTSGDAMAAAACERIGKDLRKEAAAQRVDFGAMAAEYYAHAAQNRKTSPDNAIEYYQNAVKIYTKKLEDNAKSRGRNEIDAAGQKEEDNINRTISHLLDEAAQMARDTGQKNPDKTAVYRVLENKFRNEIYQRMPSETEEDQTMRDENTIRMKAIMKENNPKSSKTEKAKLAQKKTEKKTK